MIDLPRHFLRLGSHAEKEYFLDHGDSYEGVVLNANLISLTTAASASLVTALRSEKALIIDPWTFVYGLESDYLMVLKKDKETGKAERELKGSYAALAEAYGGPILRLVKSEAWQRRGGRLSPADFNKADVEEVAKRVLTFQGRVLEQELEEDEYFGQDVPLRPDVLIAPYFFNETPDWSSLNLQLLDAAMKVNPFKNIPVVPMISISPGELHPMNRGNLERLLDEYTSRDAEGYLLWVSDFDDAECSDDQLDGFTHAIGRLKAAGDVFIMNMYGGFFSASLLSWQLDAFSHSVGYGESKDARPPSGGVPVPKYYFPSLHIRVDAETVLRMIQDSIRETRVFEDMVCSCEVCRSVIQEDLQHFARFAETKKSKKADLPEHLRDRRYVTGQAKKLNNLHFLLVRHREVEEIGDQTPVQVATGLRSQKATYEEVFGDVPVPLIPSAEHLRRWARALQSISEG